MLSSQIRQLRTARNLSQVQLAKALGVTKQSVSNWENNNIQPSIDMLVKIARFLCVNRLSAVPGRPAAAGHQRPFASGDCPSAAADRRHPHTPVGARAFRRHAAGRAHKKRLPARRCNQKALGRQFGRMKNARQP